MSPWTGIIKKRIFLTRVSPSGRQGTDWGPVGWPLALAKAATLAWSCQGSTDVQRDLKPWVWPMPVTTRNTTFLGSRDPYKSTVTSLTWGAHTQYPAIPLHPSPFQSSQPRSPLSAPPFSAEAHSEEDLQMAAKFWQFCVNSFSKMSWDGFPPGRGPRPHWRKVCEPQEMKTLLWLESYGDAAGSVPLFEARKEGILLLTSQLAACSPRKKSQGQGVTLAILWSLSEMYQPQCDHICHGLGKSLLLSPPVTSKSLGTAS